LRGALESDEIALRVALREIRFALIGRSIVSEPTVDRSPADAYDQGVKTVTRIATWVDAVVTRLFGFVLRAVAAVLALVLRRGKYRGWRRRGADARRRASRS
jgi:hypothetical protein